MPKPIVFADAGAVFSECRRYRYHLHRSWSMPFANSRGRVLFVMLNPSTADEAKLDPTLRRCYGYAHAWGFERFDVCNLFALRSTDPTQIYKSDEPATVVAENNLTIREHARLAHLVVAGWGVHGRHRERGAIVRDMIRRLDVRVYCLGANGDGTPKHPLYLPKKAHLIEL